MPLRLQVAGKSDIGCVRSNNEDSFGYRLAAGDREGILVVCDGMGGQPCGDVASDLAVKTLLQQFAAAGNHRISGPKFLAEAIAAANTAIRRAADGKAEMQGMGTTIVAALAENDAIAIAHAGDSRAYLLRGGKLQQITEDHSYVMEQVRRGIMSARQAETSALQNIILRALGTEDTVEVDFTEFDAQAGDLLLLCSDGLSKMLADTEIEQIILANPAAGIDEACGALVSKAREAGGYDNITVLLAQFESAS